MLTLVRAGIQMSKTKRALFDVDSVNDEVYDKAIWRRFLLKGSRFVIRLSRSSSKVCESRMRIFMPRKLEK